MNITVQSVYISLKLLLVKQISVSLRYSKKLETVKIFKISKWKLFVWQFKILYAVSHE